MTTSRNINQPQLTVIRNNKSNTRDTKEAKEAFVYSYDDYIHKSNSEVIESYLRELAQNFYYEGFQAGYAKAKGND